MANWREMGEPPIDPPDNEHSSPDLKVLSGSGRNGTDPHELSYIAAQLGDAYQRQFQEDLSIQLDQLCDTSLRPIDRADPQWATMIRVATALVARGVRITNGHVGGYLGGACLLQLDGEDGVRVRWSQHDALGYQYDDPRYRAVARIMDDALGDALADVLRVLGFTVTATEYPGNYIVR
jgi:hypothetical protein